MREVHWDGQPADGRGRGAAAGAGMPRLRHRHARLGASLHFHFKGEPEPQARGQASGRVPLLLVGENPPWLQPHRVLQDVAVP